MKYRKKPVVIDAWLVSVPIIVSVPITTNTPQWVVDAWLNDSLSKDDSGKYYVKTLEGKMYFKEGYYLVKGVHGELYAVKPDIFKETYEWVERDE